MELTKRNISLTKDGVTIRIVIADYYNYSITAFTSIGEKTIAALHFDEKAGTSFVRKTNGYSDEEIISELLLMMNSLTKAIASGIPPVPGDSISTTDNFLDVERRVIYTYDKKSNITSIQFNLTILDRELHS